MTGRDTLRFDGKCDGHKPEYDRLARSFLAPALHHNFSVQFSDGLNRQPDRACRCGRPNQSEHLGHHTHKRSGFLIGARSPELPCRFSRTAICSHITRVLSASRRGSARLGYGACNSAFQIRERRPVGRWRPLGPVTANWDQRFQSCCRIRSCCRIAQFRGVRNAAGGQIVGDFLLSPVFRPQRSRVRRWSLGGPATNCAPPLTCSQLRLPVFRKPFRSARR